MFDDFEDGSISSNWSQVSGTWTETSGELRQSGTSGAKIITTVTNPNGGRMYLLVTMKPGGDENYVLYVNYENATTFQKVEIQLAPNTITLVAGAQTRAYTGLAVSFDRMTEWTAIAVIDDGFLYVGFSDSSLSFQGCVWDNTVTVNPDGNKAGLGNGGSTGVEYESFQFQQHNRDNDQCPDMGCWCTDGNGNRYYPAWKLRLDWYAPYGDNCSDIGGSYALLEFDCAMGRWVTVSGDHSGVAAGPQGYGTLPVSSMGVGDVPQVICGMDDRCEWGLVQDDYWGFCCTEMTSTWCTGAVACTDDPATSLDCDPEAWQVRWDAIVSNGNCTCYLCGCGLPPDDFSGSYYVIATENV